MVLKDNLIYWKISLNNLEPVVDEYYIFDELIIEDKNLIKKAERLRELIITYCVLLENKNNAIEKIFQEIYRILLSIKNIQYHEFVAFWKVLDISFSVFKKLTNKREVLRDILKKYCEKRRRYYDKMGYSNVTVQALYDVGTSRKKGSAANVKIIDLINHFFENPVKVKKLDELVKNEIAYFLPDRGDENLFKEFHKKYNIKYEFGKHHQGKLFDIALKVNNEFFLIEAKHMKEGGGAQSKQMVEVIEFIGYSEDLNNIHYVTFLDGIYFNRFGKAKLGGRKRDRQKQDILKNLNKNKNNYFVNTAGLKAIFQDLVK